MTRSRSIPTVPGLVLDETQRGEAQVVPGLGAFPPGVPVSLTRLGVDEERARELIETGAPLRLVEMTEAPVDGAAAGETAGADADADANAEGGTSAGEGA